MSDAPIPLRELVWTRRARWERALVTAAALCLTAAPLVLPAARAVSPGFAVWSACPLQPQDEGVQRAGLPATGRAPLTARDPWGQPFRYRAEETLTGMGRSWRPVSAVAAYSVGPDGIDAGGQGGDDVPVRAEARYLAVAQAPFALLAVAAARAWWAGDPELPATGQVVVQARGLRAGAEGSSESAGFAVLATEPLTPSPVAVVDPRVLDRPDRVEVRVPVEAGRVSWVRVDMRTGETALEMVEPLEPAGGR